MGIFIDETQAVCKAAGKYITVVTISLQATHKDTEQHAPQLCLIRDLAEALKALLTEKSLIDDKVSLLNSNWIAVTSRSEQWLNLLLVRKTDYTSDCLFIIHFL